MARFKLKLEYAGTRYRGWQDQANARTDPGENQRDVSELGARRAFAVSGSGRAVAGLALPLEDGPPRGRCPGRSRTRSDGTGRRPPAPQGEHRAPRGGDGPSFRPVSGGRALPGRPVRSPASLGGGRGSRDALESIVQVPPVPIRFDDFV